MLSHEPQSEQIQLNGMCVLVYLINYIVFSVYFLLFPCMSFVSFYFFIFSSARKFFYIMTSTVFMIFASTKPETNLLQPDQHLSLPQLRLWCTLHQGANALGCCASDLSLLDLLAGHRGTVPMHPAMILLWYRSIDLSIHTSINLSTYLSKINTDMNK